MKKKLSLIGVLTGILIIISGIATISGGFGGASSYAGMSPYDSGFASFGGDYYTYSVNNTAETASAARAVVQNLLDISELLQFCIGIYLIGFGIVVVCGFGIVYAESHMCTETENIEKLGVNNEINNEEMDEVPEELEESFMDSGKEDE